MNDVVILEIRSDKRRIKGMIKGMLNLNLS